MERLRFDPRPDWDAKAEALGFTWRHDDGKPYWDETAAYAFSLAEIEDTRYKACEKTDTPIQNIIDEIVGLYLSTLYKLQFLA